ncbi:hypothetical protein BG46_15845 [Brucella anthropi]|uniref:hypothetical protein n=1 Tax=Brucella anthropi TaxID=529 RepID=UPI00044D9C4B|nr:hypothetical protein [Brucella anthropi]EXL06555.1 hypothetical protein BG46_15845 [Brucella anthropi]
MTETKFTPGPWKTFNGTDVFPVAVTEGWFYIADCDPSNAPMSRDDDGMSYAQAQANARLIAAAPDLYEMLSDCISSMQAIGVKGLDQEIKNGLAALAKARGEA